VSRASKRTGKRPSPTKLPAYCGPNARVRLRSAIERLDSRRWAIQPKHDGCYAVISTNKSGAVSSVRSRTGRAYSPTQHGLKGQIIGPPRSILIGEGRWHTPDATRASLEAGYTVVTLFDALRLDGRSLAKEPYSVRRDALWRAHAKLEHDGVPDRDYTTDRYGRRKSKRSGRYKAELGPVNWGRAPIVDQCRPSLAGDILARVGLNPWVEGVVAVALDAPAGKGKRKHKIVWTLTCVVLGRAGRTLLVGWQGESFTVPDGGHVDLLPGEAVEVGYEGFYGESMLPRFPRVIRDRRDLR